MIGTILDKLDELGIADNTIVIYTTDNGPHQNTWPDAGTTPFRSEKNTNWEGAFRVPAMIRWPGHIEPGIGRQRHLLRPRLVPDAARRRRRHRTSRSGCSPARRSTASEYKNHLDGYNQLPYLTGESDESARKEFFYFNDDGQIVGDALRELEARLRRAARDGHHADLGRALHAAAGAEDVRPARRSLRARRHHLEHLLRLAGPTTPTWWSRRRPASRSSSAPSRSSRRHSARRASRSTRSRRTWKSRSRTSAAGSSRRKILAAGCLAAR